MTSIYEHQLDKNAANYVALSPVSFVERSAEVFGDLPAVVHGARRYSWAQTRERAACLAAGLRALGVGRGTLSVNRRTALIFPIVYRPANLSGVRAR